jgi:hypothetical protein
MARPDGSVAVPAIFITEQLGAFDSVARALAQWRSLWDSASPSDLTILPTFRPWMDQELKSFLKGAREALRSAEGIRFEGFCDRVSGRFRPSVLSG